MPQRRVLTTSQPQVPAQLDWSNPICRGLVFAVMPSVHGDMDIVTGTRLSRAGSLIRRTYPSGEVGHQMGLGNGYLSRAADGLGQRLTLFSRMGCANSSATMVPLCVTNSAANNQRFSLQNSLNNRSGYFRVSDANTTASANGSFDISYGGTYPGRLISVCAVQDGDAVGRLYENGVMVASDSTAVGAQTFNTISVGANRRATPFGSDGVLTSMGMVWSRALTDAEIQSISANPWQVFL